MQIDIRTFSSLTIGARSRTIVIRERIRGNVSCLGAKATRRTILLHGKSSIHVS